MSTTEHLRLAASHAIVAYDKRMQRSRFYNPNGLGIMLERLHEVEREVNRAIARGVDPHVAWVAGVTNGFDDRLRDTILRALVRAKVPTGGDPKRPCCSACARGQKHACKRGRDPRGRFSRSGRDPKAHNPKKKLSPRQQEKYDAILRSHGEDEMRRRWREAEAAGVLNKDPHRAHFLHEVAKYAAYAKPAEMKRIREHMGDREAEFRQGLADEAAKLLRHTHRGDSWGFR